MIHRSTVRRRIPYREVTPGHAESGLHVRHGLLDSPVLYLSRYIVRTKSRYYALLQAVREEDAWEEWVLYMLTAVEETARQGIDTIRAIRTLFFDMKHRIRQECRFYSQDLLNNLFGWEASEFAAPSPTSYSVRQRRSRTPDRPIH